MTSHLTESTTDMAQPSYLIRRMDRREVGLCVDWAAREGWNPGLNDAVCFYLADPRGFFLGQLEGRPIAVRSAVAYDRKFAFFGNYIVDPAWRGRGYGLALTHRALQYVGSRNVGLDGVLNMCGKYERLGFRTAHHNIRFRFQTPGQTALDLVPLAGVPMDEVNRYDRIHFSAYRGLFLRHWLTQSRAAALGSLDEAGRLTGYGVIRPCREGWKIGPLFADDPATAEKLLLALAEHADGETVFIDMPDINTQASALAVRYNMEPVFEVKRMYTAGMPEMAIGQVYGITTFELG